MNQVVTTNHKPMLLHPLADSVKRLDAEVLAIGGAAPHMLIDGVKRLNTEVSSVLTGGAAPHMLIDGMKRLNPQASLMLTV